MKRLSEARIQNDCSLAGLMQPKVFMQEVFLPASFCEVRNAKFYRFRTQALAFQLP